MRNNQNQNQKTIVLEKVNFKDKYHFYENGDTIKIDLKKESDLPIILEKLKNNKNIKKLYVPIDVFNKRIFKDFLYNDLFSNFSFFDMKETSKNFIITKKKITDGEYIVLPITFFWYPEELEKITTDLKQNTNLKYLYAEKYLTNESSIKTLINDLGFTIKINKSTSKYFLYELKKK